MTLQLAGERKGTGVHPGPRWRCPPAVLATTRAVQREWFAVLIVASAAFAAVVALISNQPPERTWGMFAAAGYGVAFLIVLAARRWGTAIRRRATGLAVVAGFTGAVAAPLGWLAVAGEAQPEVGVTIRSAALLLHRGTPYQGAAALAAAHSPYAYDPYLPALIVFGLPRAVLGGGPLTDPRLWFGLVFATTFAAALTLLGTRRPGWWTTIVIASPVVAFPLSVGGDDLPVLGLICLGFALLAEPRGRSWPRLAAAGVVLGLAAAMKATAWPALVVVLVLVASRQGRRAAALLALAVLAMTGLADGPVALTHPGAMVLNTIKFPLGMAKVASPAESVLPGHLIAMAGGAGHWAAVGLVVTAGLAAGAWLVARPPADVRAAVWRLAVGLTALFLLAPATRAGYFMYPLGLAAWLLLTRPGRPGATGVAAASSPPEIREPAPAGRPAS
ncbi:MAG TPA: glycosyltransferase 87 family protein [Streptosporangiaceae bacterium]